MNSKSESEPYGAPKETSQQKKKYVSGAHTTGTRNYFFQKKTARSICNFFNHYGMNVKVSTSNNEMKKRVRQFVSLYVLLFCISMSFYPFLNSSEYSFIIKHKNCLKWNPVCFLTLLLVHHCRPTTPPKRCSFDDDLIDTCQKLYSSV